MNDFRFGVNWVQLLIRSVTPGIGDLGVAIGIAAALGLTELMRSLLFGVSPQDPLTLASVAALLILVALLASYIPARRAMLVDPAVALRYE